MRIFISSFSQGIPFSFASSRAISIAWSYPRFLSLALLSALYLLQGLGNRRTGRLLGPAMLLWLLFIGAAGAAQLPGAPQILRALDPRLGLRFLFDRRNPMGFGLLGLAFFSVPYVIP